MVLRACCWPPLRHPSKLWCDTAAAVWACFFLCQVQRGLVCESGSRYASRWVAVPQCAHDAERWLLGVATQSSCKLYTFRRLSHLLPTLWAACLVPCLRYATTTAAVRFASPG